MELRKDYILDRWVIIAEKRNHRPVEFKEEKVNHAHSCVFCPGNEEKTPEEISRVQKNGKWKIRVIPNKFAAVSKEKPFKISESGIYTQSEAYGSHEVIIETPNHEKRFSEQNESDLISILKTYAERISEIEKDKQIKYVSVFKNEGEDAGASIFHSHTQIISLPMMPKDISEKIKSSKKSKSCPYCEIVKRERKSKRKCFENSDFLVFTPYASRFNYEVWIVPKKHLTRFENFTENTYKNLASVLKKTMKKVKKISPSYNMLINYAPKGNDLHFHIEIIPRLSRWGGFEFETGTIINTVSPESAAKYYTKK